MEIRMFQLFLGGIILVSAGLVVPGAHAQPALPAARAAGTQEAIVRPVQSAPVSQAVLTLDEAFRIGLESNPSIASAHASLAAAGFGVDAARTGFMPQVTASVGYRRATQNSASSSAAGLSAIGVPSVGSRSSTASMDNYSASLGLQQTVWDFGRTLGPFDAAKAHGRAAAASLRSTIEDTLLTVGRAYFVAIAAREAVAAAEESKSQMTEHLKAARGRVEAGIRPRIDATRAEADLASADLSLVQARNLERISRVILATSMGRPDLPHVTLVRPPASELPGAEDLDSSVKEAMANRPERVQLHEQLVAAQAQIAAARGGYFPSLGANAGLTYTGFKLPDLAWNWYVGASLTWGLVSGIVQANALSKQAEANLAGLKADLMSLDQSIRADVEKAMVTWSEAREKQAPAQAMLVAARETSELAEARYAVGSGNVLEIADAQATLIKARNSVIQAELDLEIARLALLRAVGRLGHAFALTGVEH